MNVRAPQRPGAQRSAAPRVVVIGAGIVGAAVALALARRGAAVTVVDGAEPGTGTSATSLAWLNANAKLPRGYHALSTAAMEAWRRLEADAPAEVRIDGPWVSWCGNVEWCGTDADRDALRSRVERLVSWGYPARTAPVEEMADLDPAVRAPAEAGLIGVFAGEGVAHTRRAVPGMLAWAQRLGAEVRRPVPVVALHPGDAAPVVELAGGERLAPDHVVCCPGWRAHRILGPLGVPPPLADPQTPGSPAVCLTLRVADVDPPLRVVLHAPGIYARPTPGGACLESPAADAALDMSTSPDALADAAADILRHARTVHTGLARARAVAARRCVRPLPLDGHPVVGPHPAVPGLHVVLTHSGVTLAPHLGTLLAAEILDGAESPDLAPYRWQRFLAG